MVTIAEHTIEETLLPEKANILDLGCRGFEFTNYFVSKGHNVFAVDADELEFTGLIGYHKCAIMGYHGVGMIIKNGDPQATRVVKRQPHTPYSEEIETYTLKSFSEAVKIPFWDLIKMDIEGAEYEVIMSLIVPPATQISWEAHLHTGIYGPLQVMEMEAKLRSLGYHPLKHAHSRAHGSGLNYWDSLWVLK